MNNKEYSLPDGWRWVKLGEICQINPKRPPLNKVDNSLTTFVPMSAIDEFLGIIKRPEQKPFVDVKKGYTYFAEDDVLFAKITPCMENGKHAIARKLISGIGFGSTEFHIIRPNEQIIAEWIWYFLRQPTILKTAKNFFTGSVGQQRIPDSFLKILEVPLPPLPEQKRIAAILNEQMAAVEKARASAESQLQFTDKLTTAYLRDSLNAGPKQQKLDDCLVEIKKGVGEKWRRYRVIGATRSGAALAKEEVGKQPERYKLVEPGTIFYNPMRINIGSIGMLDEGDEPGITSPDYVVFKTRTGKLHPRWFYYWLRSPYGEAFIKTMARGAVRERMLFNRLASASIELPSWDIQCETAEKLRKARNMRQGIAEFLEIISRLPAKLLYRAFSGDI
jgi:type I restriction enzyme, S subunit